MLKVFVTDLSAYNKGYLIGEWVDLPIVDIDDCIKHVLLKGEDVCAKEYGYEEHEEYFITDWEWEDVDVFHVDEYENIHNLNNQLKLLKNETTYTLKVVSFLLSQNIATNIEDALSKIDSVVLHENQDMNDVAYEFLSSYYDIDNLPSIIANNIDYEGVARELQYDGRYYEMNRDIYEYIDMWGIVYVKI